MKTQLAQKIKDIKSGKMTVRENVMQFAKQIDKLNKELNIYLVLNDEALKQAEALDEKIKAKKTVGKLAGLCCAIKSNISVKNLETNCASKVLEGYISGYDATVIQKLKQEDVII